MCIFGGGGGARAAEKLQQQQADQARADADAKAASLKTGMANIDTAFSGFNDDYFNKLQQNYIDYAQPQLQDQYDQAKKDITYSLARKGNLDSTTAGDQQALLDRENAKNLTAISGAGADYANAAKADVQSAKQNVQGQLNTTYDADAANTLALNQARALAVPKSFSPIAQAFTNISALAAQSKLASTSSPYGYAPTGARLYGSSPTASYVG